MFRVERPTLLNTIVEGLEERSIVLTGSPGVGKTWIITQVISRLKAAGRRYLPLTAEEYNVDSLEELERALALQTDLITVLRGLGPGCVLIIDGMDALRSDISQRPFRQLIEAVTSRVPDCAVLVSIRTFDLHQSNALQRVFFGVSSLNLRSFKEVVVGALTADELRSVAQQTPDLGNLINDTSREISELVRVPFNLHLCLQLLNRGSSWRDLSAAQSQTQLMGLYWEARVNRAGDAAQRRTYLRSVLRKMVENNSLSLPQEEVEDAHVPSVINHLQSDEIVKFSATGRISFAHNILFDYAVARLLLDETSFKAFVEQDASRSLFFRPSLIFFLNFLWLADRSLFWQVSLDVFGSDNLPERMRVIVATAIYESASTISDLQPLLKAPEDVSGVGTTALLRAIHAFDGIQSSKQPLWLALIAELAATPRMVFINEFLALLNRAEQFANAVGIQSAAKSARQFLSWIFTQARSMSPQKAAELRDTGIGRILPFIIRTYNLGPDESKQIVLEILAGLGSSYSGPHEASRLAHEISTLVHFDAPLAVEVYERLFAHEETSKETTALGGPVFQMRSTRQQDFSLSHYNLQTSFKAFLSVSPIEAARAAIKSVNAEVPREHKPKDEEGEAFTFVFLGSPVRFVSDHSEIWDRGVRNHISLQLLDASFSHATELLGAEQTQSTGKAMISEIGHQAELAVCWKHLLEASKRNPERLFFASRDLLIEPLLLAAPETTIEAGEVLKAIHGNIAVSDIDELAIENAILSINTASIIQRYEKATSIRNRLLLCIPADRLLTPAAVAVGSDATQKARGNRPYHHMTFGTLSNDEVLRLRGIDPDDPTTARILETLAPLEEFERDSINKVPSIEDCLPMANHLQKAAALLRHEALKQELAERARGAICAVAEVIVKNPKWKTDDPLWQECRTILLKGAHDPVPVYDERHHEKFDHPGWGSPSPRIDSARGLINLVWNWGLDEEVIGALNELLLDQVPAVRYQIANGLTALYKHGAKAEWLKMAFHIVDHEQTSGVMLGALQSIGQVSNNDSGSVISLLRRVIARGFLARDQVSDYVMEILVWLYAARNNGEADLLLNEIEDDVLRSGKAVMGEIFSASAYFSTEDAEKVSACRRACELYQRIIASVYAIWSRVTKPDEPPPEGGADLYGIVDQIAMRLAFAFRATGINPSKRTAIRLDDQGDLYLALKPVFEKLTEQIANSVNRPLLAPTAHHLMQTFNVVLDYDPAAVIEYAAKVCRAVYDYHFDQMAISEAVNFAQQVMADHKDTLHDKASASALGDILDIFVRAGWPEAVRMAFLVDEAIR